jgi:hypothetical protein
MAARSGNFTALAIAKPCRRRNGSDRKIIPSERFQAKWNPVRRPETQ